MDSVSTQACQCVSLTSIVSSVLSTAWLDNGQDVAPSTREDSVVGTDVDPVTPRSRWSTGRSRAGRCPRGVSGKSKPRPPTRDRPAGKEQLPGWRDSVRASPVLARRVRVGCCQGPGT